MAWTTTTVTGCGTLLHPERRGQRTGDLDWKIVALDGLGLMLFFVPGVIAFAVDFATGAIFLPADEVIGDARDSQRLLRRDLPPESQTPDGIAQVVSQEIQRPVQLQDGSYEVRNLKSLDEFWPTWQQLRG